MTMQRHFTMILTDFRLECHLASPDDWFSFYLVTVLVTVLGRGTASPLHRRLSNGTGLNVGPQMPAARPIAWPDPKTMLQCAKTEKM
jgi:hypothetical protein